MGDTQSGLPHGASPSTGASTDPPPSLTIALYAHEYQASCIRLADAKAGFSVALLAALLTVLFSSDRHLLLAWPRLATFMGVSSAVAFSGLVLGICMAFNSVRPRLATGTPNGLLYFGSISSYANGKAYAEAFTGKNPDQLTAAVLMHTHELAAIAACKFRFLRFSTAIGAVGAAGSLISLCGV